MKTAIAADGTQSDHETFIAAGRWLNNYQPQYCVRGFRVFGDVIRHASQVDEELQSERDRLATIEARSRATEDRLVSMGFFG